MDSLSLIVVGGMSQGQGASQPLWDCLPPFYDNVLDIVLLQKGEDRLRDIVGSVGGGRTRLDSNPYNDWTETPLVPLSWLGVCEEACRVNGGALDISCNDDVDNLGTDSIPGLIQRGIEGPID